MSFLIDFTNLKNNNILYGGNAGLKKGIVWNNKNWLIKFPQETSNFDNVNISFTTSPLSEYVGSHIYEILGYKVHNTKLGFFMNEKIARKQVVVACEDFTENGRYKLLDYECIKNNYSDDLQIKLIELNENLPKSKSSTSSQHSIKIEEIILQFNENNIFKENSEIRNLFWDMLVIDCVINNNDRNKNNWGLLYDTLTKTYSIAPIYDNGASFVSKHTDEKLLGIMSSDSKMKNSVLNGMCYYTIDNEVMNFKNFFKKLELKKLDKDFKLAIQRVIPRFKKKWNDITQFIYDIPREDQFLKVMSDVQKKFFIESMQIRLNDIFNADLFY